MFILDAHCDAPSQMLRLRDYSLDNHHAQVDFPKMRRGDVWASCFAFYIPADCSDPYGYMEKLRLETLRQLDANKAVAAQAVSAEEVKANRDKGLLSIIFALENGSPIGDSLDRVQELYDKGIRYVTLTHSADNQICDSCTGKGTWGGLSPFGRELVGEMNRVGLTIDLAHCSDDTIRDVLSLTRKPVVYTHGGCRALCEHKRNLPDDLLSGIAQTGGVVGISAYPLFLSPEASGVLEASGLQNEEGVESAFIADPSNPVKRKAWENLQDRLTALPRPGVGVMWAHLEHAIELCGEDHVGIGTDYDGIELTLAGMETVEGLRKLPALFEKNGLGKEAAQKVFSGNFLRIFA